MPAHHHRRRTALATALTAVAGSIALVLAGPAHATFPGRNGLHRVLQLHRPWRPDLHRAPERPRPAPDHPRQRRCLNVDWSPDGRRIAFDIETPDSAQIAIMNADGSGLVTLPKAPGNIIEVDPSFTPDGRRLVFSTNNGGDDALWSMKLDGTDRRLIKTGATADPNVSPDGRRIAFLSFNGEPFGKALSTSSIDGSKPLQLTPFSFNVGFRLDWAPDGRQLAFIHNVDLVDPEPLRQHRDDPPGRNRPAVRDQLPRPTGQSLLRQLLPRWPLDRVPPRGPTASSACTRSTPTERTSARSSASRTSRRGSSTGVAHAARREDGDA